MEQDPILAVGGFIIFLSFIIWLFSGFIGWIISKKKGRGLAGFMWGFWLGPIGWIISATLEPSDAVRQERAIRDAALVKQATGG